MADRVKGITIEIGGDTTGLSKALSGVNKDINSTQKQLRDVERLLKMDPGNVELLAQKERLLSQAVEETSQKLGTLKEAQKQVQEQFERGDIGIEQYEALQREIAATEQSLKSLEARAQQGTTRLEKISGAANKISAGAKKVSTTLAPVTTGIAAIGAAAVATIPATQELRSDLSRLDANAQENAVSADVAREAWRKFAIQSGETDSAVEAVSNLLQAGFTESNLEKAVEGLAGAAQRFPDTLKIESLADSLQETLATGTATGQFGELLDRLGIGAENFSEQLQGCTDTASRQNLALQTLADAGLNDTYNAWAANNEEMIANQDATLRLQEATSQLAETMLPMVTTLTEKAADLLGWFTSLDPSLQKLLITILALVAAISPISNAVSGFSGLISTLTTTGIPALSGAIGTLSGAVLPTLGSAFSSVAAFIISNPITLIIAAIVGLVALIVTKGDEIKEILNSLDDWLQNVFAVDWTEIFGPVLGGALNTFFDLVEALWTNIKGVLSGIIDFVQGVFSGNWEQAWNGIKQIFQSIFESLAMIAKAPINGIIDLLNGAIDKVNDFIGAINKIGVDLPDWLGGGRLGFNIPEIPNIPKLARGGVLSSGTALVGEAGPELLTILGGGKAQVTPLTGSPATAAVGGVSIGSLTINPSAAQWGQLMDLLGQWQGARQARRAF